MAISEAQGGAKSAALRPAKVERPPGGGRKWAALVFLLPALVLLGGFIIYPTLDTFAQSFQSDVDRTFVGLENYQTMLETERIRTALINSAIWVVIAPALVTGLGLIFAVLTERVRYQTAIKTILFMPMAISALAVGVIWRGVYETNPDIGLANSVIQSGVNAVKAGGHYPDATILPGAGVEQQEGTIVATQEVSPGEISRIGIVGIDEPAGASAAELPQVGSDEVGVLVWRDFKPGGGGKAGELDQGEVSAPDAIVELVDSSGEVVATETTEDSGVATFSNPGQGPFTARLAAANFEPPFEGINWLGAKEMTPLGYPHLVTLALIFAWLWMSLGFAVVVVGSGLSALPRDVLEAARVDGASEWQVFRHVTMPLLKPVLVVIFITLTINVLKIFDIVYVLAPSATQDESNVIALEMWKSAFSARDYGVGAAVAVVLFILVIPIMFINLRRFRREGS